MALVKVWEGCGRGHTLAVATLDDGSPRGGRPQMVPAGAARSHVQAKGKLVKPCA